MMECELNSIYKFSKSYTERYEEYCSILCGDNDEIFSIRERWSVYLEVSMDSSLSTHGWYAYWNILRTYCDGMNITFPKVVQVRVIEVNYEKLSANITIINTQDDEELESVDSVIEAVPLKDLYVTTSQEVPNLDEIANCLDQLRFFYHHLWWPWVDEENEINGKSAVDWILEHLKHRLELYYDKLEGKIPYTSAKTIKRLMDKCKESYDLLQNTYDLDTTFVDRSELNTMIVELNMWSVSEIRQLKIEEEKKRSITRSVLIALRECEIHDAETHLCQVQDMLDLKKLHDIPFKLISSNFENCHLNYDANDIILLTPGQYKLNYMEYFDFPVTIMGVNSPETTVISDKRSQWSIFQFLTASACVENVAFDLKFSHTVFIIKRGILTLYGVWFNNIQSVDTAAIQLHRNSKLIAQKCRFSNFNTAIICQQDAVVELNNCTFENNFSCVQFTEGAKITMNNCDLRSTESTPFIYKRTSNQDKFLETSCESLEHLSRIPGVSINETQLDDEMIAVENT